MRSAAILLISACLAWADKKPITPGRSANDNMQVEASALITKEDVSKAVSPDLPANIVVVEVTLTPRNGQTVKIDRDDFLLMSFSSGQRSQPFSPAQIAGSSTMVVTSQSSRSVMGQQRQRPWG
ncbi:MAG: hypothetical protein NTV70_15820, partial [Acidobacteria bacterium]|nr:hypothetical protein [Acidobacteriota bacterium]